MSVKELIEKFAAPNDCNDLSVMTLNISSDNLNQTRFNLLPLEILYQIFETCDLKEQLSLSRVCKLFRQIISKLCQQKFKCFPYNYLTFKYTLQLDDLQISELCALCSKAVHYVTFSTYFNMDLLKGIEWTGERTNPMENIKFFINDNFKQNVRYFQNLQDLEVQGKFLQDHAVLELTKSCKQLRTLKLMDGDNRWFLGKNLQDLENIENLQLKSCRNLDYNNLLETCRRRNIKQLNIVECDHFKDIPKMLKLCFHLPHLNTLRLTAFSQDPEFLKAILNLPSLKVLQFFWLNFMPLNFEENFFLELNKNKEKLLNLRHLKFENDRYYLEDESQQQWTDDKYAIMRENVCINGQSWQWSDEVFQTVAPVLENLTNLLTISFSYCRLLSYDQLLQLPQINKNLKMLKIYGCPKSEDALFKQQWLERSSSENCFLNFESFLTVTEVMNLHNEANSRQFSSFYRREPVFRSIECQFD